MVETIWEGDVMHFSRAFQLICIVDQIHDYAFHQHRDFVMKHLEARYARKNTFKKEFERLVGDDEDLDTDMDNSSSLDDADLSQERNTARNEQLEY
ncbi:hypothetical protein AUP68_00111 [Ilyonectria robusta]